MTDREKLIVEIEKMLPEAPWPVLRFVYFYLIR